MGSFRTPLYPHGTVLLYICNYFHHVRSLLPVFIKVSVDHFKLQPCVWKGMFALEKALKSLEFFTQKSPQTWNPPYSVKQRTNSKVNPRMALINRESCADITVPFIFPLMHQSVMSPCEKLTTKLMESYWKEYVINLIHTIAWLISILSLSMLVLNNLIYNSQI